MFPDSEIAGRFACSERKMAYLCTFGIAPYFKSLLTVQVRREARFVLLFDESMNKTTKSKQLNLRARFFNDRTGQVVTRYISSAFLGHSTACDLQEKFDECAEGLNMINLLQVSTDGPAVN